MIFLIADFFLERPGRAGFDDLSRPKIFLEGFFFGGFCMWLVFVF